MNRTPGRFKLKEETGRTISYKLNTAAEKSLPRFKQMWIENTTIIYRLMAAASGQELYMFTFPHVIFWEEVLVPTLAINKQ